MGKLIKKFRLILFIGMITIPTMLVAQVTEDDPATPPNPGEGGGGGVTDAPFDDGVGLLIAAGVAFGLKRVYDKKKAVKYKAY